MKFAWIAIGFVSAAVGQTPPPAFEAASVKASNETQWQDKTNPGLMVEHGATLRNLITLAFGVKDDQVSGGPKWMDSDRYDIDAKAAGPAKDPELFRMLQTLLADRFHLEIHRETKPFPGYALLVSRGGIRAKAAADPVHPESQSHNGSLVAKAIPMGRFAQWLSRRISAPVVDATGLSAPFDFTLQWDSTTDRAGLPNTLENAPTAADPRAQPLYIAIQEQLGLRLEPRNVPMEMIEVARAEKPTLN